MRIRKQKKPQFWLIKAAIGLGMLGLSVFATYAYVNFALRATHGLARVERLNRESQASGRRGGRLVIERPYVVFSSATGQTYHATAKVFSRRLFVVGESVEVAYDPRRPEDTVQVDTGLPFPDLGIGIAGLIIFGLGALERWNWRKHLQYLRYQELQAGNTAAARALPTATDALRQGVQHGAI